MVATDIGGDIIQAPAAYLGGTQCLLPDQLGTDQLAAKIFIAGNGGKRQRAVVEIDPPMQIGGIDSKTARLVRACQKPEDFLQRKNIEMPCQRHCLTPFPGIARWIRPLWTGP